MIRTLIFIAAVFGFLGVAFGAFGAHGLAAQFAANPGSEDTYKTAVQYQMIHTLMLVAVSILLQNESLSQQRWLRFSGWLFVLGIVVFSGSLYLLSVFQLRFMGVVAPLGGLALLGGWLCFGLGVRNITK